MSLYTELGGMEMIFVSGAGLPRRYIETAEKMMCDVITLPPCHALPAPLSSHADLLICPMGDKLYTYGDYYGIASAQLDRLAAATKLDIRFLEATPGNVYPKDTPLCVRRVGGHVILNPATAPEICRAATVAGLTVIGTRQGYAACSAAAIGDSAIITADQGIKKAAEAAGIELLLISPGEIDLPGFDYGFIGGACGVCRERREVWFAGDPLTHPHGARIVDFIKRHGYRAVPLSDGKLFDCGGMFFF